jgi:hypothetical protein
MGGWGYEVRAVLLFHIGDLVQHALEIVDRFRLVPR